MADLPTIASPTVIDRPDFNAVVTRVNENTNRVAMAPLRIIITNYSAIPNRVVPSGYTDDILWDASRLPRPTAAQFTAITAKMAENDHLRVRRVQ